MVGALLCLLLAGCATPLLSDAGPAVRRGAGSAERALATTVPPATRPPTTTAPPTTTTTTVPPTTTTTEQPGWTVVSTEAAGIAVDRLGVTGPGGGVVTVVRFHAGLVRYGLHVGSGDPSVGGAVLPLDSGPSIGPDEAPLLLAAFNGGFKTSSGGGGFELDGQVLSPLLPAMASLVIDTDGTAHLGVWGQTVPTPGEPVASVRQNLAPLVSGGVANPSVGDIAAWGATLGGGPSVARSALGQDAQGNLLYAAGMSLTPGDLAAGLVAGGAVAAMELDINPEWVQADAASTAGTPLSALIPGQNRAASQYQAGWTRDFITVLATH